ncbi:DUF551 domain-containing protein [Klebsiella pneumoniae]|uniref:DUF551 domain-containing protein n=1 Tax=Klebsiella pneumoniae TaxID=573 RepID=UPI00211BF74D|nr:DUF551 domain-containing protein [Klebsiella pneumoniae]MCQ9538427.1 DUF551 domain-containing protein [Klebsiella pneumoniae]
MTKSAITRERLEWLSQISCRDDIEDIGGDEIRELASIALAAMDSEPVAFTDERNLGYIDRGRETAYLWGKQNSEASDVALYRHAQPAVDSDFIPKNLDKALGVVGVAIPESREEFNLQAERWIQRLIDRVIRYADEFQEQPALVVPDEIKHRIGGLDWGWEGEFNRGWNACRAAMLAAAPQSPGGDHATVPDKWIPVSERMPEMGEKQRYVLAADFKNNYWPNIPNTQVGVYGDWFDDGNPTWDDGDGEDLHLKEVTHWMPLPAGPKEVQGE